LAKATGHETTVRAMEQELKEGKTLDEKLTELAEKEITPALLSEEMEDEESSEEGGKEGGRKRGENGSPRHAPRH
jgi:hypothetical protein